MQKINQSTPKTRRIRRVNHGPVMDSILNTTTMESTTNISVAATRHRATMLPSDFLTAQNLTKRFVNDCNNNEVMLQYDKYLQAIMTEMIVKKRAEEEEILILSKLASVAKERERNEEKLLKLKIRERDLISLSKIQNNIDSQITDVKKLIGNENFKAVQSIICQLHLLLQRIDVLCCSNIILPKSREEWNELNDALKTCNDILKSILNSIGTKKETYESLNDNIKGFSSVYSDIENHHKRVEKELCDLQALVLKSVSLSLSSNMDEDIMQ